MKRLIVAAVFLFMAVGARAATVTLTWNYDYTGLTLCSATATTNCLDHFEMDDASSGTPALIATVANPANASGKVHGNQRDVSDVGIWAKSSGRDGGGEGWIWQLRFERLDEVPGDVSDCAIGAECFGGYGAVGKAAVGRSPLALGLRCRSLFGCLTNT